MASKAEPETKPEICEEVKTPRIGNILYLHHFNWALIPPGALHPKLQALQDPN